MRKLKLYVWEGVLTDYTSGVMLALAPSAEEARIQILMKSKTRKEAKEALAVARGAASPEEAYWGADSMTRDLLQEPKEVKGKCAFAVWGGG